MNTDQVKGKFEQVVGKTKQAIGEAVGDNKTANEGLGDQIKGAGRETWGNVKDASHASSTGVATETTTTTHDDVADTRRGISNAVENVKNAVNDHIDSYKETHRR
jgi:uncharacterized protein YjbJ (UPF0337 family)